MDFQKVMLSMKNKKGSTINKTGKCPLAMKRSMVAASVKVASVDCRKVLSDVKDRKVVDVDHPSELFGSKERKTKKSSYEQTQNI